MKKQLMPVLIVLLVGMSAFVGLTSADSGRGISPAELSYTSDQMKSQPVKIYEKIGDVSFSYSGSTLTYHIYFGLAFPTINGSQKIAAYIYLLTDSQYVTNAGVTLTYSIDITFNGKHITTSGSVSDSTSFMQFGEELYAFEMVGQNFASSEFPMTMDIDLDYQLSSGDLPGFSKTGVYSTSKYFLSTIMELWVLIVLICAAVGVLVIVIVVVVVRKKNQYRGPVSPPSGTLPPYTPPSGTVIYYNPPGGPRPTTPPGEPGPSTPQGGSGPTTPADGTEKPYRPV